jgi:hypothetical protein
MYLKFERDGAGIYHNEEKIISVACSEIRGERTVDQMNKEQLNRDQMKCERKKRSIKWKSELRSVKCWQMNGLVMNIGYNNVEFPPSQLIIPIS